MSIYRVVNGTRRLVATITTGVTGTYTSPALPPGNYEVAVDKQGTAVAGYDQTTQTGTGGVATITLRGNVSGANFGFFNDAALTTTPITLASFQALPGATAGTLEVKWMTATEAGNVGFFVHGRTYGSEWQKLTPKLIPSKTVDSLEPQTYTVTLSNVAWGQEVALEDVSVRGRKTRHGPFAIGTVVGVPPTVERIKWLAIWQAKDLELKRSKRRVLRGKPATGLMRAARLSVRTPGIQRVTHEQLLAAGIDLSKVPVAQIAVTDNGQLMPRAIGGRPIFGPGSYIEFIGQVTPTLYSNENVYLLTVDPTKSRKVKDIAAGAGPAAVAEHEAIYTAYPNREYSFNAPTGDPWYDAYVLAYGGPASLRRDFTLSAVVAGAARMKVALWGYIDWPTAGADHHVMVKLNPLLRFSRAGI
ncbi:MAG: carboxypeptidase regulatory-like domain-containing protein [Deltaproteobacteria bacterium]|nr:carboxypeptidase regulatory-like domain-containing protein [Deltaproteobacteria bacterium]